MPSQTFIHLYQTKTQMQDCNAQCDHSFLSLTFVYVSKEVGLVCPSFVNVIGCWPTFSNRIWWGGENMLYGFIN